MDRRSLLQQSCKIAGKRLPSEYARVEYLESTGTQWIDSGWAPTIDGCDVQMKIAMKDIVTKQIPFGWYETVSSNGYMPIITSDIGGLAFRFNEANSPQSAVISVDTPVTVQMIAQNYKKALIVNSQSIYNDVAVSMQTISTTAYIFASHDIGEPGGIYAKAKAKLYYLKIFVNSKCVRNFLPVVRLSDMKPGLYDLVNDQFYVNQGTGEFLYGPLVEPMPDVPGLYQKVEYIESTTTQYINTNVYPNSNVNIIIDFELTEPPGVNGVFGTGVSGRPRTTFTIEGNNNGYNVSAHLQYTQQISFLAANRMQVNFNDLSHQLRVNNVIVGKFADTERYDNVGVPPIALLVNGHAHTIDTTRIDAKLYSCQIFDNSIPVRDFVPCYRKSDSKPGLFDLVNGVFYTNAGTGEFLLGPLVDVPSEYQKVEYISSNLDRSQYIDTGVAVTNTTGVSLQAKLNVNLPNQVLIGALELGVGRFQPYYYSGDRELTSTINLAGDGLTLSSSGAEEIHLIEYNINNRSILFDGISKGNVENIGSTSKTIYLFCRNYGTTEYERLYTRARIYSCKLYDNSIPVRNFIPCYRKSDGEIGLFDLIKGVFYTNQGTGTFLKGPDV